MTYFDSAGKLRTNAGRLVDSRDAAEEREAAFLSEVERRAGASREEMVRVLRGPAAEYSTSVYKMTYRWMQAILGESK